MVARPEWALHFFEQVQPEHACMHAVRLLCHGSFFVCMCIPFCLTHNAPCKSGLQALGHVAVMAEAIAQAPLLQNRSPGVPAHAYC